MLLLAPREGEGATAAAVAACLLLLEARLLTDGERLGAERLMRCSSVSGSERL